MKAIIICGLFVVVGCAIQPMELSRMSDSGVCSLASTGGPETSQNAKAEAQKRQKSCAK